MKKVVFIGIVLLSNFVGNFTYAVKTETPPATAESPTETKTEIANAALAEAQAKLAKLKANPAISNALKDLEIEKETIKEKIVKLKAKREAIQKLGPTATADEKKQMIILDSQIVNEEADLVNVKKRIASNEITIATEKVTTLLGETAIYKLAYATSAGFDASKYLKVSGNSHEDSLTIVPDIQDDKNNIFYKIIRLMTQAIGSFAILMMIVAGYFMITSKGDESRLTKGKNIFTNTIIGLVLAFLSYMAVTIIISIIF